MVVNRVRLRQRCCCGGAEVGGLLEERALINHICSGDVSLMPELKRDQVVGEEDLIKEGRREAEN